MQSADFVVYREMRFTVKRIKGILADKYKLQCL